MKEWHLQEGCSPMVASSHHPVFLFSRGEGHSCVGREKRKYITIARLFFFEIQPSCAKILAPPIALVNQVTTMSL